MKNYSYLFHTIPISRPFQCDRVVVLFCHRHVLHILAHKNQQRKEKKIHKHRCTLSMRRNRVYCLGINDYNSKVFALYCWSSEKKTTQTRTIIFCMKWFFFVCVSFDLFLIRKCKMLYLHMYINNSSS